MTKSIDRLTLLGTFVRIAERGSISAAARDLELSQASASRHLSALEDRLGVRLVERTTHALALTEAGQSALVDARALLDGWEGLSERLDDCDGALSGPLHVVAPVALGQLHLIDLALDWQADHPGVVVNWVLDDGEINVAETGCDLWIRIGAPKDDRLIVHKLCRVERMAVAAPALAEQVERAEPDGLARTPSVVLAPFEGVSTTLTDGEGVHVELSGDRAFITNNIFAARQAALRGLGYAVLPKWFVEADLSAGRLVDVLPKWRAPSMMITACLLPSRRRSRRLAAFLDALRTGVANMPGVGA